MTPLDSWGNLSTFIGSTHLAESSQMAELGQLEELEFMSPEMGTNGYGEST